MIKYPKIKTLWRRMDSGTVMPGAFSCNEFEYLANLDWVWTEKIDGMNIRVIYQFGKVTIRGRTGNAQLPPMLLESLTESFTPDTFRSAFGVVPDDQCRAICLYGEGCGTGIQKNGDRYGASQDFILFDVWVNGLWLRRSDVDNVACKFGIRHSPIIGVGPLRRCSECVQQGFNAYCSSKPAEGVVARPALEFFSRTGERIICKIKTKDFAFKRTENNDD